MKIEYFHFVSTSRGNRYFKVDWVNGKCIQICIDAGEKKGRSNMVGIYHMALSSFRGTYHWYFGRKQLAGHSEMLGTTKNQYDKAFGQMIEFLKGVGAE